MTVREDKRYVVSFQSFFGFLAVYCPFTTFTLLSPAKLFRFRSFHLFNLSPLY